MSQVPGQIRPRSQPRSTVGASPVGVPGVVLLTGFTLAVAILALYGLWRLWPAPLPASGQAPASARFSYFSWHLSLTRDQQFFVIAALAGAIGAVLHGLRSLSTYIGERYLFRSWIAYYLLLPVVGGLLATIVYLVLRAGLLTGSTNSSQPDPYGIAAISALVGLFSAQAAEKLKAVFETLFTKAETGSESITNIVSPSITGFQPPQGLPGTEVIVTGENLSSVTEVVFATAKTPPFTVDSETRLTVVVPGGAVTGPIILRSDHDQVASSLPFTVTVPATDQHGRRAARWGRR
jgi:IPT/TIG domain